MNISYDLTLNISTPDTDNLNIRDIAQTLVFQGRIAALELRAETLKSRKAQKRNAGLVKELREAIRDLDQNLSRYGTDHAGILWSALDDYINATTDSRDSAALKLRDNRAWLSSRNQYMAQELAAQAVLEILQDSFDGDERDTEISEVQYFYCLVDAIGHYWKNVRHELMDHPLEARQEDLFKKAIKSSVLESLTELAQRLSWKVSMLQAEDFYNRNEKAILAEVLDRS